MLLGLTRWLLFCLLISIVPGICADESDILENNQPELSEYVGSDVIEFTSAPGGEGSRSIFLDDIQGQIRRVIEADMGNPIVIAEAHKIIRQANCSGPYNPNQFCAIFNYSYT